jgi:hypothetical protein
VSSSSRSSLSSAGPGQVDERALRAAPLTVGIAWSAVDAGNFSMNSFGFFSLN